MTEVVYKFTRSGAVSRFRDFAWPADEWVEIAGPLGLCTNGIHACRVQELPRWVDDELWRVELDGVEEEHEGILVARRGRLLERIEGWDPETSRELARACAGRALELAERVRDPLVGARAAMIAAIADGPDPCATALALYTTAHTFDDVQPGSYYEERRRQAEWLRERLRLDGA